MPSETVLRQPQPPQLPDSEVGGVTNWFLDAAPRGAAVRGQVRDLVSRSDSV